MLYIFIYGYYNNINSITLYTCMCRVNPRRYSPRYAYSVAMRIVILSPPTSRARGAGQGVYYDSLFTYTNMLM